MCGNTYLQGRAEKRTVLLVSRVCFTGRGEWRRAHVFTDCFLLHVRDLVAVGKVLL